MGDTKDKKPQGQIATFYSNLQQKGYSLRGIKDLPSIAPDYSALELGRAIRNENNIEARRLSHYFYRKSGTYQRIINHYATILDYSYLLIPHLSNKVSYKSDTFLEKDYQKVLEMIDSTRLQENFSRWALEVLIYGEYFGLVKALDKKEIIFIDLPREYCRSTTKDFYGNDIVEFNLLYFNTILDMEKREEILSIYPEVIVSSYNDFMTRGGADFWISLPASVGFYFSLVDGVPPFLSTINSIDNYHQSVVLELERNREEIQKVLIQKVPHLNDGTLLFEPVEAEAMHTGTVGMLGENKNIAVLTTYADVDVATSRNQSEASKTSSLNAMAQNIYQEAGVSGQLFSSTNAQALKFSIQNDIAFMMRLANSFATFTTRLINYLFRKNQVSYTFTILPVGRLNAKDYIEDAMKLATTGFSFLLPGVAMGLSQREIVSIKDLENDLLKLEERLKPLSTSYTQSDGGRPEKSLEDKSERTVQNIESAGKGGEQ